jgi:hypothetical protein
MILSLTAAPLSRESGCGGGINQLLQLVVLTHEPPGQTLRGAMTTCPPDHVLSILGQIVGPLVERAVKNDLESRTLAQTRDLLLPKLMSGEIRLKDAEKAVEAVA